jgi:asparagine synthase (glutamine-hydrolysing)
MGFAVPVAFWLKKEWAERSDELVRGERALGRGTFRPQYLNRIMDEHRAGQRDNSAMIWRLMMLELWYREWVD